MGDKNFSCSLLFVLQRQAGFRRPERRSLCILHSCCNLPPNVLKRGVCSAFNTDKLSPRGRLHTTGGCQCKLCNYSCVNSIAEVELLSSTYCGDFTAVSQQRNLSHRLTLFSFCGVLKSMGEYLVVDLLCLY